MPASKGSALLKKWRKNNGDLSQDGLAELLRSHDPDARASQAAVSNWEKGVQDPPARAVVLLARLTKGEVPAASWFDPPDPEPANDAVADKHRKVA